MVMTIKLTFLQTLVLFFILEFFFFSFLTRDHLLSKDTLGEAVFFLFVCLSIKTLSSQHESMIFVVSEASKHNLTQNGLLINSRGSKHIDFFLIGYTSMWCQSALKCLYIDSNLFSASGLPL